MANTDKIEDNPDYEDEKKQHDIWYKLRSVGGIATAVMVAIIGSAGSCVIQNQQATATRAQLYTSLMSQRENAENNVRKDMFQQILSSFLSNQTGKGCLIEQIDEDLLRLELLSRNFHETIEMEPLFLHVLLRIVREIPRLPNPYGTAIPGTGVFDLAEEQSVVKEPDTSEICQYKLRRLYKMDMGPSVSKENPNIDKDKWERFKGILMKKKINQLVRIAQRITRKQIESLCSVEKRHRMIINLSETCTDIRPDEPAIECKGKEQGKDEWFELDLERRVKRKFRILVCRSYPDWNQVRIKVEALLTEEESKADPGAKKNERGEPVHVSEFWLGFFDFPLADSTFLSDKERYSVILDKIDQEKKEAHISLLYFPASYAGLKEKSFYQQKLISTLMEKKGI